MCVCVELGLEERRCGAFTFQRFTETCWSLIKSSVSTHKQSRRMFATCATMHISKGSLSKHLYLSKCTNTRCIDNTEIFTHIIYWTVITTGHVEIHFNLEGLMLNCWFLSLNNVTLKWYTFKMINTLMVIYSNRTSLKGLSLNVFMLSTVLFTLQRSWQFKEIFQYFE